MLKDHGQTAQRSLPTEGVLPQRAGASMKASDMSGSGQRAEVITPIATWLRDGLREYAAEEMPDASWDEVVHRALAVGLGALNGFVDARPGNRIAVPEVAVAPAVAPTWQAEVLRKLRAAAVANGGPMVVNIFDVERIAGRGASPGSRRGIGAVVAGASRKGPQEGLRVEHLGRPAGAACVSYRLTAVDD